MALELVQTLQNSLVGDNLTLQQTNNKLAEMSKHEGYCIALMQIINQPSYNIPLKQAALIQLKNNVKAKWKPKNQKLELTANEKNTIRNALVRAIVLCAKNHILIKLYRQVLTTIVGYQFETWLPVSQIMELLHKGEGLAPVFHCIISICTNFQFSVADKERLIYNEFLKQILPAVLQTVKNNFSDELLYLALKILWKAVHYEVGVQIKTLTNDWMELVLLAIDTTNEEMQKHVFEHQVKYTPQFFYFHSKKWATRILMRYVQKHAKVYHFGKVNTQNAQYSKFWYQTYGMKFCEVIVKHLEVPIPTTKKIRYFQLKIIQGIVVDVPDMLISQAQHFQYNILLRYMRLTQEDANLAKEDVLQYLRNDDDMSSSFCNIKRAATEVWNSFMQIGCKIDREKNIYQPGPFFQKNLQFMLSKIASEDLIQKQLGMYLFCENRMNVNRIAANKQQMEIVLEKYVIPQLGSPVDLIRAKANDMFYEYGKQITNVNIIKNALAGIYKCLTEDPSPLVRIKAAIALNPIISNNQVKTFLQPYLQNVLQVYLKLIEQYDLEQVVSALQYFISDFSQSIGPFAIDLFKYLSTIFAKMFTKDIQLSQNDQYGSQLQLAASGCLKTMTQIIQAPLEPAVRAQIEPCVLDLCTFIFTNESLDYIQDLMFMMRVHTEKIQKISPQLWFYYQVLIYFIAGIPNQLFAQIQNMPNIHETNKQILSNIKGGDNIQFLQHVVPVLRNFFGKGCAMIVAQKDEFKINFVHMIFYLVGYVYKKGNSKTQFEGEIHFDCCSILLVYLIQTFPPEMTKSVVGSVWNIIKYNISKGTTLYLKQITVQMIAVLLWKHPIDFMQIIFKENHFKLLVTQLNSIAPRLDESQQRKRVILGLCSYMMMVQHNPDVLGIEVPKLFAVLIKLMLKNCRTRIIMNSTDASYKKTLINQNDESEQDHEENEDDDEDMWDEQYNQRHISVLKTVNQLQYFKQTIDKISTEYPQLYQVMINSVPQAKLESLNLLLQAAINLNQI